MNHQQAHEKLMAYLDAHLSDIERAALERHLAGCAECQRELADLQAADAWLGQSINAVAGSANAPNDAWARFESRIRSEQQFGQRQVRKQMRMESTRRNQPPMGLLMGFAAAAAAIVLVGIGIVAMVLMNNDDGGQVAVVPVSITPSATGTQEQGFPAPGSTFLPTPTLTELEAYMTQRPQSGGGSGQPDGGDGSAGLPPHWQGTVTAVDLVAGTVTLDSGQTARMVEPITYINVQDITLDGYKGTFADVHVGDYIGIDLLDVEPELPYAQWVWVNRNLTDPFAGMSYERNGGRISAIDPNTGVFSVEPWGDRVFRFESTTPVYRNDITQDGEPAALSELKVGDQLDFITLTEDQGNPSQVLQIIIEANSFIPVNGMFKATVTAVNGTVLEVDTIDNPYMTIIDVPSVDLGNRAEAAGVSFAVGDVIFLRVRFTYSDMGATQTLATIGVFKHLTGQYVPLLDESGNPLP